MFVSRRRMIGLGLVAILGPLPCAAGVQQHLEADQIKAVLRAKTDEEKAFLDHVIDMVERGKLPRKIFDSAFQWARRKQSHRYEYFYHAITALAKREHIDLT